MKIYSDYDKKLSDYYAVKRNSKRAYKLFIFISIILLGLSIYFFIIMLNSITSTNIIKFTVAITASIMFFFAGFVRWYIFNILPKKNPLFDEIFSVYKSKQLINELGSYGIEKANLDAIINPKGYIEIAYIYDKYCYLEIDIQKNLITFSKEIRNIVKEKSTDKIFDKYLKKKYGKIKNIKSKGYTKDKLYKEILNYIEIAKLDELSTLCQNSIEESKKFLR